MCAGSPQLNFPKLWLLSSLRILRINPRSYKYFIMPQARLPGRLILWQGMHCGVQVIGPTMRFAAACAVMLICIGIVPCHAEKRLALVIGNNNYLNLPAAQQLKKAINDSHSVADALGTLGFEVIRGEDLGRQALVD